MGGSASQNFSYVEGAAYHEAAHIVIAAVQGLPLGKDGLRVYENGAGFAHYSGKQPDGSTNLGADPCREGTIIATLAGHIAHGKCYPPVEKGDANASDDFDRVRALLLEMYPDNSDQYREAQCALHKRSKELVDQHWATIKALATKLWDRDWLPQAPAANCREKHIEGEEVVSLLRLYGIPAAEKSGWNTGRV
jgi:hypothetical protein